MTYTIDTDGSVFFTMGEGNAQEAGEIVFPPVTDDEFLQQEAQELKGDMIDTLGWVNISVTSGQFTEAENTQLLAYRDQIWDLRDLPGTPEDILAAMTQIIIGIRAIVGFKFRFEP